MGRLIRCGDTEVSKGDEEEGAQAVLKLECVTKDDPQVLFLFLF